MRLHDSYVSITDLMSCCAVGVLVMETNEENERRKRDLYEG